MKKEKVMIVEDNESPRSLTKFLLNRIKDPVELFHSRIVRHDPENSKYKSCCPFCETGVLLMQRNQESLKLLAEDSCNVCGRRVKYMDLKETNLS